jgi:glyceraldehyde 3-phosphate dehydrogenase
MSLKVAINGFGRIGRSVTRLISMRHDIELVALNDIMNIDMMAYLLRNDSVHGHFDQDITIINEDEIQIGQDRVKVSHKHHPRDIDFASSGAQLVIECTGLFLTQEDATHYINNGVQKVILSAPANDEITPTFVLGVNEKSYKGERIVSNASCTTNCLAPIAKIMDEAFGIQKGLMTTIHSYTNDQNILDMTHKGDKRRSRAGAVNIIPTSTGAAKAIGRVLPNLSGKLHGQSVRVPTPDVSMMDLNLVLETDTTKEEIDALLKEKASTSLKDILLIDEQMRVSQDFINCPYSAIVAEDLLQVIDGNMIKIMAWYDNEWGYSNRLLEMALYITDKELNGTI